MWVRIQILVWCSSSCLWHSHCTLLYTLIDSNYETHLWAFANHATAETFSHWHLNTEVGVQYQSNPCEICGGQCGTGTGFSLSNSVFHISTIPPILHSHLFMYHWHCMTSAIDIAIYNILKKKRQLLIPLLYTKDCYFSVQRFKVWICFLSFEDQNMFTCGCISLRYSCLIAMFCDTLPKSGTLLIF